MHFAPMRINVTWLSSLFRAAEAQAISGPRQLLDSQDRLFLHNAGKRFRQWVRQSASAFCIEPPAQPARRSCSTSLVPAGEFAKPAKRYGIFQQFILLFL